MLYNRIKQISPGTLTEIAAFQATSQKHGNKITNLDLAAGFAVTLPQATGSGDQYTFTITTLITGSMTIKARDASDSFVGMVVGVDTDVEGASGYSWNADAADDTITLNGVATGGKAGDTLIITDLAAGKFLVHGFIAQSGGSEATPFSATVS